MQAHGRKESTDMQLVEQHIINQNDPRFAVIDAAAFKSKNLYNAALYEMRQTFIHEGIYLPYEEMDKRMKQLKKKLPKEDRERVTKQMERITNKRNRQVDHYLHLASRRIVDFLVKEGVGTVVIGKNPLWKQGVNNGRHNNQNFVNIPHARFIEMITYKAALVGIQVEVTEESYTSKANFLDLDEIPVYHTNDEEAHVFSGKRIGKRKRLYRTKDGREVCADVNGAYNILRKRKPDAFPKAKGIAAYVVQPVRLAV
jgi:putative transposase